MVSQLNFNRYARCHCGNNTFSFFSSTFKKQRFFTVQCLRCLTRLSFKPETSLMEVENRIRHIFSPAMPKFWSYLRKDFLALDDALTNSSEEVDVIEKAVSIDFL